MLKKIYNRIGGIWMFFGFVSLIYVISALFYSDSVLLAIKESLSLFVSWIWIFALIFAVMVLIDLFVTKKLIMKFFNKSNPIVAWIFIIIGGIISTGPIYMWYPILSELQEKGLADHFIVGFLYNRSIKIPLIIPMISAFGDIGVKLVIVLFIVLIVFSIVNGYVVEMILNRIKRREKVYVKN